MRAQVVDLFCGIGGLSYGFVKEGFNVTKGIDSDELCRFAYEENVGASFISTDVQDLVGVKARELFSSSGGRKILIGCAPCQPFSIYAGRYRKAEKRSKKSGDSQWKLLRDFARIVKAAKPDVVSMENVPRVVRHRVFKTFVNDLEKAGYTVSHYIVRAQHYGIPQRRTRLVLFASKLGRVDLIDPTHADRPRTVRDAISHLPPIGAGSDKQDKRDRLHRSRALSEINRKRLRATKQGGSWKDWDEELLLACHKKKKGASFRSVYGRMTWDQPSPVITTQCLGLGNGRFGHPSQTRAISIREAALLQSFPASFKFVPSDKPVIGVVLARQIGNAVPVRLGRAIARSIKRHLVETSRPSSA
ncbi:MAG: DNA cytosine methyltransferase [Vicinamibacterales bacterium]